MNADLANNIFRMVVRGLTFEQSGLEQKHKEHFNRILQEVKSAPQGTMMAPVNEWVGDEYDDIIAAFERVESRATLTKSIGTYELNKSDGEKRYTLGAMYIPDRVDAHGEWTDGEELQRAVWDYVKSNDRRIRLQHNRDVVAGEWVEVMSFPYELSVPMTTISGVPITHTYPANTVFLGVVWEPWAWDMVKEGKILGYSIGGKAERLYVDMEKSEPTVNDVHVDTIMNPTKKKPKDKDERKRSKDAR